MNMKTNQKKRVTFGVCLFLMVSFTILIQSCVFDKSGIKAGNPLTVAPPPDGCTGQTYFYDVNSYFGVYGFSPFPQYQLSTGSIPPGLHLDTGTGIISGIPTLTGDFDFQVQAIDTTLVVLATGDFIIRISDFSIMTAQLPPICDGSAYAAVIDICGGVPPFTWETLDWDPAALPLNFTDPGPSDTRQNTLAGTPVNADDYRFTVRVTDSRGDAFRIEKTFELEIVDELTILTPRNLPIGVVGVPYTHALEACGGVDPLGWDSSGSWPSFISIDPVSGVISGTPITPGVFLFKVKLSDGNAASTEKWFSLTVAAAPLVISSTNVICVECLNCSHNLSVMLSGGMGIPFWQLASGSVLPPMLTLSSDGILSGMSTTPGVFHFDVVVFDGSTDPLNPPQGTVTVTVSDNPADSGIMIERARQWPADPLDPNYQPPDRINLAVDRIVKFDFLITDSNWESTWNAMAPNPWNPVELRQVRLSIVGLCGISITTDNIGAGDVDGDGVSEHVARFPLSDPLVQDFLELISSGGGIAQSPFTFRIQLEIPESMGTLAVDRIADIVVVDEP
jgi:hypothetical protein